ncbi:MAG: hypothetical protein ABJL72_06455 [Roseobacter sp.]
MHPHQYNNGPGNRGPGADMQGGFASCAAAMIAMLLGSPLNDFTVPYVIHLAEMSHPPDIVRAFEFIWMVLCYPLVFFASRAAIVAAMTMAGVYLAYRLI